MRVVYTGGTFDLFHIGHIELLQYCASLGDRVVVGLNTDEFVERYKGKPSIMGYNERRDILRATRYVDHVIRNIGDEDSKEILEIVKPNIIVIGMDWLARDYCKQMGFTPEWLSEKEIILCYAPRTKGVSTTQLKERV